MKPAFAYYGGKGRLGPSWTNPGELVLSPFGGIGSEGWASMGVRRRFYGIELKDSYYRQACRNLATREREIWSKLSLFDEISAR